MFLLSDYFFRDKLPCRSVATPFSFGVRKNAKLGHRKRLALCVCSSRFDKQYTILF